MKRILKRSGALLITLALILTGFGMTTQDSFAASSVTVYVTVSDQGTLAVAGGKIMANIPVTISTAQKSVTLHQVMVALHNKYKAGGYKYDTSKNYVTKIWGNDTASALFFINNQSCASGVKVEKVASGGHVTVAVMADGKYYSDYYTYFPNYSKTVFKGDQLAVDLKGFSGMMGGTPVGMNNLQIGIMTTTGFKPIDGVTTNMSGEVTIDTSSAMFEAGKTYYISATGSVPTTAQDWSTGSPVDVKTDAPIVAPFLKLTVNSYETALKNTQSYYVKKLTNPKLGNEWPIISMARNGYVNEAYYKKYVTNLTSYINKNKGVISSTKSTDVARVILAYTAMGKDPVKVSNYNLLKNLADYNYITKQGINGAMWALIATNAGNYEIPTVAGVATQGTEELYLSVLYDGQLADGGWALQGTKSDVDMTAMGLQALAPYYNKDAQAKTAVDKGLQFLSKAQLNNGGYESYMSTENCESAAQVVIALTALGIDPTKDARFIKNGNSVMNAMLAYYCSGGGFRHVMKTTSGLDADRDATATEQGYQALVSYKRFIAASAAGNLAGTASQEGEALKASTPAYGKTLYNDMSDMIARMTIGGTVLSKATSSKSKTIKASWTKTANAKGYEVRYSKSSSFSSYTKKLITSGSTLSKTTTAFTKGKNYYVKVRAYTKSLDGVKKYGSWSKVRKVKVK